MTRPPNILFILADDLGWRDVGFNGTDFYETPNLDRLAEQGMVFSNAYATAANCAPSRASLHSGQYGPRHGVYAVGSTRRGPKAMQRLVPIPNQQYLAGDSVTIAEAMKQAGYVTGLFGKWHLGTDAGHRPTDQGFDVYFNPREENPDRKRDEPDDPKGIYSLTQATIAFMEENRDRPFFALLSHLAIHPELEARPSSLARFEAKPPGEQHRRAIYAACTYDLDDGIGILLQRLDELGLADTTLVVLTSDNGATPQSSQEPLRGNKGCYYEGGIREPFIARWPGRIAPGTINATPVTHLDLYPTFLAVANAPAPPGKTLDGESLLPLMTGTGTPRRSAIFWHFPGYLETPVIRGRDPVFRTRPVSVIRLGDWKLHLYHEEWQLDGGRTALETNRAVELYNLATDIGERNDLARLEPAKRDELLDALLAWFEAIGAPVPSEPNPGFDPNVRLSRSEKRSDTAAE